MSVMPDHALASLLVEVDRQDRVHQVGYPATRDGVFAGISTAVWELEREALTAWQMNKHTENWTDVRAEMVQAAAVIMRTVRSIDAARDAR